MRKLITLFALLLFTTSFIASCTKDSNPTPELSACENGQGTDGVCGAEIDGRDK